MRNDIPYITKKALREISCGLSFAHHAKESTWLGCLLIITALHLDVILIIVTCSQKTTKIEIMCTLGAKSRECGTNPSETLDKLVK